MTDFLLAFRFWLVFEILSLPLRFALAPFPMRNDVRRMLSRVAGPLALGFAIWVAAHFGVRIGPVPTGGVFLAALAGGLAVWRRVDSTGPRPGLTTLLLPSFRKHRWKREVGLEVFSLALFFGYVSFIRLAPDMNFAQQNGGAEKFTNAMLFWSCWYAETLPPQDYWLAGVPQVYYTFGHFFWAWIGRTGLFAPEVVIPLALARLTLLIWESSYLFARAWGMRIGAAAFGALLMAWGGNPEAVVSAIAQAMGLERSTFMAPPYSPEWHLPQWNWGGYYYWDAARVLNGAITEVPGWTSIHAEFHSHHMALPWMLGFFAVLMGGDRWFRGSNRRLAGPVLLVGIWGVLGCAAALTSLWLVPLVALGAFGVFLWKRSSGRGGAFFPAALVVGLGGTLFALIRMSSGALPAPPPDPMAYATGWRAWLDRSPIRILGWSQRSSLIEIFRHWGFQIGVLGTASGTMLLTTQRNVNQFRLAGGAALLLALQLFIVRNDTYLVWFAVLALVGAMAIGDRPWLRQRPAIFLSIAIAMLGGMEIYYIRDGNPIYVRVNTYFKLSLPLWPVLTLGAWSMALRLWRAPIRPWGLALVRTALLLLIPAVFTMPVLSAPARTIQARRGDIVPREATLNSFAWLHHRRGYEAEAQMLDWIRNNVGPRMTMIEYAYDIPFEDRPGYRNSQAGSYGYFARIASLGGRPVPIGWPHHEFQWRGAEIDPLIEKREASIRRLYGASTTEEIHEAAMELGATWVVLGKVERDHLGETQFEKLKALLGSAGHLRGAFPEDEPQSFVFELH